MNQDSARALAERLIQKGGSLVPWTRRSLTSGGASGTMNEVGEPVVHTVRAAQTEPQAFKQAPQWWTSSTLHVIVAASGLPFDPEAASSEPEVQFTDTVTWAGREYRVSGTRAWFAPGDTPRPYMYFVGLVA